MVAISLYRGNMHRVPDVPRSWLMPKPTISVKDFRRLTHRRDRIISSTSNPNPNPNSTPNLSSEQQGEVVGDNECSKKLPISTTKPEELPQNPPEQPENNNKDNDPKQEKEEEEEKRVVIDSQNQGVLKPNLRIELPMEVDELISSPVTKSALPEEENLLVSCQPTVKMSENVDLLTEKEKRKKELEEKLEVLNGRKHNLVQMLKQILNAEEEMKRRNNMQVSGVRPPVSLQAEATSDFGSSPRQNAARVVSEAILSGDVEGESEDVSTHHTHARHLQQVRGSSPSASSPRRKAAHSSLQPNPVLHPPRATPSTSSMLLGGVTASPSRFAPTGPPHQGSHPPNLPAPVSVSGNQFIASSPSPAASGGTSIFRESRLTSPS